MIDAVYPYSNFEKDILEMSGLLLSLILYSERNKGNSTEFMRIYRIYRERYNRVSLLKKDGDIEKEINDQLNLYPQEFGFYKSRIKEAIEILRKFKPPLNEDYKEEIRKLKNKIMYLHVTLRGFAHEVFEKRVREAELLQNLYYLKKLFQNSCLF